MTESEPSTEAEIVETSSDPESDAQVVDTQVAEAQVADAQVVDAQVAEAQEAPVAEAQEAPVAEAETNPESDRPGATGTPVSFEDLAEGAVTGVDGKATLELLYDLSLPLTVELGRAAMMVQDVLALGQGSVIRLDRIAGDPVDVYVGSKKLAQAEVVVLDGQFGIRITHIFSEQGSTED